MGHNTPATPYAMLDDLDLRLRPLVSLRTATAELLEEARAALRSGCPSQDRHAVARLERQLASFDLHINRSRRSLSRATR
jgi:hypothetical protein